MKSQAVYYHRTLPHYYVDGYPLFITFRLADSLPQGVLIELKTQRKMELRLLKAKTIAERLIIDQKYFERYDNWLDQCASGHRWLQIDNIAQTVAKEILGLNGDKYKLMAYCIMPNHVHLLIEPFNRELINHLGPSAKYPVSDALRLLKGRTARSCNMELKWNGEFWQHESYDHVIRDKQELSQTILYILNNPVKAALVKEWKDWKYTYVSPELGQW